MSKKIVKTEWWNIELWAKKPGGVLKYRGIHHQSVEQEKDSRFRVGGGMAHWFCLKVETYDDGSFEVT